MASMKEPAAQLMSPGSSPRARYYAARPQRSATAREFWNLVADFEYLVRSGGSQPDLDVARAKARLNTRIAAAKTTVEQLGPPLMAGARHALRRAAQGVMKKPWRSVAIVIGAAVLVAYLMRLRPTE